MKLKFVAAAVLLLTAGLWRSAAADKTDPLYPRHEVSFGLSPITSSAIAIKFGVDILTEEISKEDLNMISDFHNTGGLMCSYSYRISQMFSLGGTASFEAGSLKVKDRDTGETQKSSIILGGAYFDVKMHWMRKKYFWLYSRADIGVSYNYTTGYANTFKLAWQAVPLAIEIGDKQMRVFIDLGIGTQGYGTVGLRYRF